MPKKRVLTASEVDSAPRRSSRVSAKPVSVIQKPTTVKKSAKKNEIVKKTKKSQTKSNQPAEKDDTDSLTDLSNVNEGENEDKLNGSDKLPPKKKIKVDKPPQGNRKESLNSKKKLAVGDKLQDAIILKNDEDADVNVLDLLAEKGLIIFIYPKSNTPGCTTQACGYRDIHEDILKAGFQVVGLSMDSPKAQTTWKQKQKLPYMLLCDPKQQLIKLLGSAKSSASVQRSHFIFEAGGKLIHVDPKASTTTSPQEALDLIVSLSNKSSDE